MPGPPDTDVVIPFELVGRTVFIQVKIGSSEPHWFVLDTGNKYAVVDLSLAKTLGVQLGDQVPVGGGGKDIIFGNFVRDSSFSVVGLQHFTQPLFIAVPLDDLARTLYGHECAGILGFDFISQYVVEIDYLKKALTLHDKAHFRYHGSGESLPITFNAASHPQVRGEVVEPDRDPIAGTFVVDIGNAASLVLNSPTVAKEHLPHPGAKTVPWLEGRGIGGRVAADVGRVKGFKLGSVLINDPVVIFAKTDSGPLASTDAEGNIGAAILEKFKVILDYENKRMILEANSKLSDPIEYNRSGIVLVTLGPPFTTFKIEAVADPSPASEAGLRAGDIVVKINGQTATKLTLSQVRRMLRDQDHCELTIKRGNENIHVKLRLRRLI